MKKTFFKSVVATVVVTAAMALSSVAVMAATYTLNANDLTKATLSDETTAMGTSDFFTITASASKTVSIDSNSKTGPITGTSYSNRIKLGGTASSIGQSGEYRTIQLTVDNTATVVVEGMSSSSNTTRYLALYDSKGNVVDEKFSNDGNSIGSYTFNITSGDTYRLASTDGGFNVYGIYVITDSVGLLPVVKGALAYDGDNTFLLAGVSSDDLSNDTLTVGIGSYSEDTSTVYTSVVTDNATINAEDFGADYLYAVKVNDVTDNTNLYSFTADLS